MNTADGYCLTFLAVDAILTPVVLTARAAQERGNIQV